MNAAFWTAESAEPREEAPEKCRDMAMKLCFSFGFIVCDEFSFDKIEDGKFESHSIFRPE